MANEYAEEMPHGIVMDERSRLRVTGVSEVVSFDENEVVMDTALGQLTVSGEGLHIEKLSLDIGELSLEGSLDSLCYSRTGKQRGSFWSKVF